MSRYYGHVLITFMDDVQQEVGGNVARTEDGQLVVSTTRQYGPPDDVRRFPLVNIRSWRWKDET